MEADTAVRRLKSSLNNVSHANNDNSKSRERGGCGDRKKKHESFFVLSEGAACALVIVFLCALWVSVHWSLKQLVIGKPSDEFNATRARKYLEHITSVGPRPAGSAENDIVTVNFLLEEVERVRSESVFGPNTITVETHKHSGSFSIDFLGGFTSCYDQITNIVVRLEPKGGAQHFVLANCHFDSVPNSPGIDLAFIENGYIYHTKYDTADRIHTDSIQRAGDNILALLKQLVTTETLADPSEYRHGSMVFFDVLGVVMVAYPARVGSIINYMVATATLIYLAKKCGRYVLELVYGSCVFLLSWFVVLLTVLIVALMVTLLGRSMFWFTHFHASILLYGSVAAGKILLIHTLAKNLYYNNMRRLDLGDLFFDVSLLLWCCALVFLTQRGLCSAYVPMLMVFFPLATKLLLSRHYAQKGVSKSYVLFYLLGLSFPYIHLLFLIWIVFEIFTPIMGRSGTEIPPDVVLASLVAMATILLSTFLHITRTLHALDGSLEKTDSGFWINSFDYTGMSHITPHVPEINDTIRMRCSEELPFCGFPWFLPVKFLIKKNWYLPAPAVMPKSPLEFKLVSKHVSDWGNVNHMSLYILPHVGSSLTGWSFADGTPQYDLNGEYFIFYSHGVDAGPWSFWIEVQPSSEHLDEESVVSVAISAHYLFGEDQHTPELRSFMHKFPDWAFTTSWVSTYHMYLY
ncbi:Endoplasmic reticulum metallopeptidase 1 [Bagarius yarrelli]|uniref:Endoplasmic reticulum metallopeptidase 1 n=1 Tax=Bagarius yarrelli TaxID=175774 RepID=A0A556TUA6_BAGYA|nr:Endoplasmic reticulum metallopeptidase 1 [Bagarius yarrelli]